MNALRESQNIVLSSVFVTVWWIYYLRVTKKHDFAKYCDYVMILASQSHKTPWFLSFFVTTQRFFLPESQNNFWVWNCESNESLYSSQNDRITLFLGLWGKKMLCQFQKPVNCHFFGTMRAGNALSVPKNCELPFFWDYEGKKCSVSSKNLHNCIFLELCAQYSSGKSQSKQLGWDYVYTLRCLRNA